MLYEKADGGGQKPTLKSSANECIYIKCCRSQKDFYSDSEELWYKPKFVNQIVENEEIHGYEDLKVTIYFASNSVMYFLRIVFSKKERGATDIDAALAPHIGMALCKTEEEFLKVCEKPFIPTIRDPICSYSQFRIYKVPLDSARPLTEDGTTIKEYHRRIQFHALVNIDGASYIDEADPKWEIYIIFEAAKGSPNYHFIGYATMYPFLGLKNSSLKEGFLERIRISQVLVLPQYQSKGHGSKLLEALYKECLVRKCLEITIEDPSESFRVLRDSQDLQNCIEQKILREVPPPGRPVQKSEIEVVRDKTRITANQVVRCYEMNMLRNIEADDEINKRKLRLMVKRRLYVQMADVLGTFAPEAKKIKLAELYDDLEQEYLTVLRVLNKRGIPCAYLGA
uniref:histone acetyltransferase n=1 Tax=Rhodosorus marinus TaxID=101924 RepID=A0A7S2Z9Q4_9RHOD|mmetsp:Transcript_10823/g.45078  ORF Transcript_10823/g.45078 Transcript_10823/m.45078 type:complete len:397 (+) Transcript_10823:193-1383(+)